MCSSSKFHRILTIYKEEKKYIYKIAGYIDENANTLVVKHHKQKYVGKFPEITIPSSIIYIDNSAFKYCKRLWVTELEETIRKDVNEVFTGKYDVIYTIDSIDVSGFKEDKLEYEQVKKVYNMLMNVLRLEEDILAISNVEYNGKIDVLLNRLVKNAIEYAGVRARCSLMSDEEAVRRNQERTDTHEKFIQSMASVVLYMKEQGLDTLVDSKFCDCMRWRGRFWSNLWEEDLELMDKDDIIRLLKAHSKKTIEKSDLENLFNTKSDEELFNLICGNQELFKPIISSRTNGNRKYPIYMKYRVLLPEEQEYDYSDEIRKLHPMLQANGWLISQQLEYKKYTSQLNQINMYLFSCKSNDEPISRKERSFSIFGEEKILDDGGIRSLLSRLDLDEQKLAFYDTPEYCLNDFIPERKADMTLLICENKDIWFNVRRLMFEDEKRTFFGKTIDGVVLGSGNRVCEKKCLSTYTNFLKAQKVSYLYWGDIDREGLDIYLRLKRDNQDLIIELFIPGYEMMLSLSQATNLPNSADHREHKYTYEKIYSLFDIEKADLLKEYINQNKRLPQEIISYAILKNN